MHVYPYYTVMCVWVSLTLRLWHTMRCLLSTSMWTVTQYHLYLTQILIGLPSLPHVMSTQGCQAWTRLAPIGINLELFKISYHYIRWTKMSRKLIFKIFRFLPFGTKSDIPDRYQALVHSWQLVYCFVWDCVCYPMSAVLTIISHTHTHWV